MNRAISLAFAIFLSACSGIPTEKRLIGTWTAPERETRRADGYLISHSKQMVDVTFKSDHTFRWSLHGHRVTDYGHWQLRDRDLIWIFTNAAPNRKAGYPFHDRILKLTDQELVYIQDKNSSPKAAGLKIYLTRRASKPRPPRASAGVRASHRKVSPAGGQNQNTEKGSL